MLRLQTDHSTYLLDSHPEISKKIIEGLCSTLMTHFTLVQNQKMFKEYKNILLTIMFCLADWCLSVPKIFLERTLVSEGISESMMSLVLRCFSTIAYTDTKNTKFSTPTTAAEQEIDYTIHADTSAESGISPNPSPRKRMINSNDENRSQANIELKDTDENTIRLAANLIIGHFINFLGHFPEQELGAARLSCLINENDDNLRLSNCETFDLEVLNAP
ncbi:unnamed protein product, partial [Medioppia subpectinata]